jgi:hypothetical protein
MPVGEIVVNEPTTTNVDGKSMDVYKPPSREDF